jgi:hypothetical protein
MPYLTPDELDALRYDSNLDAFTPYVIQGTSIGPLSLIRHYAGCTYGGREYCYIPTTDELIREDVVRWVTKRRKAAQRAARAADEAQQMEML